MKNLPTDRSDLIDIVVILAADGRTVTQIAHQLKVGEDIICRLANANRIIIKAFNKPKHRLPTYETAPRQKYNLKKRLALAAGKEFTIAFKDITFNEYCPVLGIKLNYYSNKMLDESPSFDRIDNTKGYVKGNVHIISNRANRIKNDASSSELVKIADYFEKLA